MGLVILFAVIGALWAAWGLLIFLLVRGRRRR
jgi:hypothetical protein